ncbi:MAG TPA: flagellar basal-body rod protein FlgF [Clostridiales bacterium UBA8153]|nr:flagellar basal-body rod protein FlgF [Clostridiales bacterium UBA8153]
MIRGLYAAASAMVMEASRLDIIANNLANVNTPGFRRDIALYRSFSDQLIMRRDAQQTPIGAIAMGAFLDAVFLTPDSGPLQRTGNALDVALLGEAYLVVATPAGQRYTRHGGLQLGRDGTLVTVSGDPVLGQAGPISVDGGQVEIRPDGAVWVDGVEGGRLLLVRFSDSSALAKEGRNLLASTAASGPSIPEPNGRVEPGFLELSNVDPVRELVAMITVMRAYEASKQALRAQDEALQHGINTGALV